MAALAGAYAHVHAHTCTHHACAPNHAGCLQVAYDASKPRVPVAGGRSGRSLKREEKALREAERVRASISVWNRAQRVCANVCGWVGVLCAGRVCAGDLVHACVHVCACLVYMHHLVHLRANVYMCATAMRSDFLLLILTPFLLLGHMRAHAHMLTHTRVHMCTCTHAHT